MQSKSKVLVVILVLIALGLGYAIYVKKYQPVVQAPQTNTQNNSGTNTNNNPTPPKEENLTADEKIIFRTPSQGATKAELDLFSQTVTRLAVKGTSLTVNDCKATPQVLQVTYGTKYTVKNEGTTEIHFGFGTDRTLIAPKGTATITANYKNGPGIYGYGCDDKTINRPIGVLLLVK